MGVTGARNHSRYAQVDVLSVAYRLAPGSKYPSQLYEAYSAFSYLKSQGYTSIVIGGDSAGANLAATLWRYLEEVTHESDSVKSLLLFSVSTLQCSFHHYILTSPCSFCSHGLT
jgi:acetyl esterase/lipase